MAFEIFYSYGRLYIVIKRSLEINTNYCKKMYNTYGHKDGGKHVRTVSYYTLLIRNGYWRERDETSHWLYKGKGYNL